ncbi:ribose-phosphate diphosphokinase [Fervidicoccus fontis]|uniref:Ribose-phosphate pyrophosphokinase n=1 Tax=Fervidicoccus fontis TaxID=683846 RepID=A0A843A9U5_9CREN|nr:ribose-phosphate diphosphokinase [Fervidicoccus fontis]MBE9391465.1 ribose-phosphate diphosphokinase [Fervidicoccus fontis]
MDIILCGTKSDWFCDNLSKSLNIKSLKVFHKVFPDGETYIRVPEEVSGKKVILAHSLSPPQNDSIWELILILEALRELDIKEINGYIPYVAYSRQDKIFLNGEPISIKALLQILSQMGMSSIYTIDIHKPNTLSYFNGTSYNIIPFKSMANMIRNMAKHPFVISPDIGALERARRLANELSTDFDYMEKKRDVYTGKIEISFHEVNLKDRDVVIVDDIISTGGTVAEAAKKIYSLGAKKVFVAVSHALLAGDAINKLKEANVYSVLSANTLPPKNGVIYYDVIPELAEILKQ